MAVKRIDHIAIVVPDIEEATAFYQGVLGLPLERVERIDEQGVTVAFFPIGGSEVELLAPLNETSGVARFLEKRGAGMHHLCLEVDDIAQALADLQARGVELIHEMPLEDASGKKMAFIHPRSTYGVLIELYELPAVPQVERAPNLAALGRRLALEVRALSAGLVAFWQELLAPATLADVAANGNGKGITLKAEGEVLAEGELEQM